MILQYYKPVCIGIIINGVDKETAILVTAIIFKQSTDIAILQIDMLDSVRPTRFGNLVNHPQTIHQILDKSKLHLVGARIV